MQKMAYQNSDTHPSFRSYHHLSVSYEAQQINPENNS